MKKIISLFLTISLVISVAACAKDKKIETTESPETTITTQTTTEATTETTEATTVVTTYPGIKKPSTKGGAAFLITNAKNKSVNQKSYCAEIFQEVNIRNNKSDDYLISTVENMFNIASKNESSISNKKVVETNDTKREETRTVYSKDGFYYVSSSGLKTKYEHSKETDESFNAVSNISSMIKSVPERAISEIREDEKTIYITVELTKEDALSLFDDILDDVEENYVLENIEKFESSQRIITSAKVDIAIDRDGYMKSYTPSITFSYMKATGGVSDVTKIAYVYSVSFFRDKEVTLDIPEGYESFPLYSEEDIFFNILADAVDKTLSLEDYSVSEYGKVDMYISGISTYVTYRSDMAVKGENSASPVFRQSTAVEVFEQLSISDIYYENGYYYIRSGNQTVKISQNQVGDEINVGIIKDSLKNAILPITKDGAAEFTVAPAQGNRTCLQFTLDETYFRLHFGGYVIEFLGLLDLGIEDMVITSPQIRVFLAEDGYIDYYEVTYTIEGTTEKDGVEMNINMSITDLYNFTARGEDVTVTPPTGYKSFPPANVNT